MTIRYYAVKLTNENIPTIVEYAKRHNLNLDYLQDTMEFNAEYGSETYTFVSVRTDEGYDDPIVTFTEMVEEDFVKNWKFTGATYLNLFETVAQV